MSDKTKIALISQLIDNHYEFFSSSDDTKNSAALEVVLDAIFTILNFEGDEEEGCCCKCAASAT